MQKKHVLVAACVLVASLLAAASVARGHGGKHEDKPAAVAEPEQPAPETNIYSLKSAEPSPAGADKDPDPLGLSEHRAASHDGMNMGMDMGAPQNGHAEHKKEDAHAQHEKPHIKAAAHEWVSPSQKGYPAAVGITILAGLVFGVLSFKRPK